MTIENRTWLLAVLVFPAFLTAGCTADADKKTAAAPLDIPDRVVENELSSPRTVVGMDKTQSANTKVAEDPSFVPNDHVQTIYFDLSKSSLNTENQATAKKNADWLTENPTYMLKVIGTADTRGSLRRNQTLAFKRAAAVRDAYVALGIPKGRILLASKIDDQPACSPVTEDCLAIDRRTDTLVENKDVALK